MDSNLNLREFPSFLDLIRELAGNNKYAIKSKFNNVMTSCPHELRILAVEGMLFKSLEGQGDHDLMLPIGNYIVRDEYRQQRINIIAHLPKHLTWDHNIAKFITLTLSQLVLERNKQLYIQNKNKYSEQLMGFIHPRVIGYTGPFNRFALEVMRYLERYVKPSRTPKYAQLANEFYCVMAKRVNEDTIDYFMEHLRDSDNYCYHGMMTALSQAAHDHVLKLKPALRFMQEKHITCREKDLVGEVSEELQTIIEVQFIRYLFANTQFHGIERFMKRVAFGAVSNEDIIERVARIHLDDLFCAIDAASRNTWLIFLTRQSTLTRYYDGFKNETLQKALHFFNYVTRMTETQQKVFCSIVALQSSPKVNCKLVGNDKLFRYFFIRCMSLLPSTRRDEVTIEFNSLHSVLYCIHNLFKINGDRLKLMYTLDPEWLEKVAHTMDMLIVTSNNIAHNKVSLPEYSDEWRRAKEKYHIVMDVGKLLGYMLGVCQKKDLELEHPFLKTSKVFGDRDWTETFTKRTYIDLTMDLIDRGYKIDFLHRKPANVVHNLYGDHTAIKAREDEELMYEAFRALFCGDIPGSYDREKKKEDETDDSNNTNSALLYLRRIQSRTRAHMEANFFCCGVGPLEKLFLRNAGMYPYCIRAENITEDSLIAEPTVKEDVELPSFFFCEQKPKRRSNSITFNQPSTSTNWATEGMRHQLNLETVENITGLMRGALVRRDEYEEKITITEEQSNNHANSTPPNEEESDEEFDRRESDDSDDDAEEEGDEDMFSEYTLPSSNDDDDDDDDGNFFDDDDDDDEELEEQDEIGFMDGPGRTIDFRRALRLASIRNFRVRFGRNLNFTHDRQRLSGMTEFTNIFGHSNAVTYEGGDITVLLGINNEPLGYFESEGRNENDYVLNETDD